MKLFKKDTSSKAGVKKEADPASSVKSARPSAARGYIIKSPLLTEKAARLEGENKYVFIVHKNANKPEIKKEIRRLFDAKAENITIVNQPRKRRVRKGHEGFTSGSKKAIVTIEKGKKIEILPT